LTSSFKLQLERCRKKTNRGMLEHISQTTVKTLASLHETWIPEWGHHASQAHFKMKLA